MEWLSDELLIYMWRSLSKPLSSLLRGRSSAAFCSSANSNPSPAAVPEDWEYCRMIST